MNMHRMDDMTVRPAAMADVDEMMCIYNYARRRMRQTGNMTQWVNGYPSREAIMRDIADGNSYVIESEGRMSGVFSFIIGADPTYSVIDGCWPDDLPYGTIHRIAAAPGVRGIADRCLEFCRSKGVGIRIDTHADNAPMLGWIKSRGFVYCGVIYIADGTPRVAFAIPRPPYLP